MVFLYHMAVNKCNFIQASSSSYRGTLGQFYDLAGILLQHEGVMAMAMSFSSSSADSFKPLQHQGDQQVQEGADFEFLRFSSTQQRAGRIHSEWLTKEFKRGITP